MSKAFSVYVNIGGRLNPSLAGAVNSAKTQVKGLEATLAGVGARITAPFIAAQKVINATAKKLEKFQRHGRNLAMTVTAPTGFAAINMIKSALERDKAGNFTEALGGVSHAERLEIENYADTLAAKFGNATGIIKTFNEMLKAGFSVASAKGSIASILEGSIVGDMPAEEVAGAVSKIVTQYGLGMKTVEDAAASSSRIADNLAYGANATSASMKDMVEAYKFVGSAASAAGESIESTNALIIGLNKAGQLGSEAGVALRSAYVRLLKPTKEGRATMARLGLDYGNYVSGGKRTGAGVTAGLSAAGFDMSGSEKDIDAALATNAGNTEGQRKAIYDAVVAKFGAEAAKDRESVLKAVDDAFAMAGSKIDLTKLLIDLKKRGATQGDLARIFEGRQSVRMLALLKSDLEGILKDINDSAPGYSGKTSNIVNQGLTKSVRELGAAWQSFSNTLVKAVLPEITTVFSSITGWLKSLAASNPAMLRLGIGLTAVAAAAGPLLFVFGALGRVGLLAMTALLAPIAWVASGIAALGVAMGGLVVAGAARLSAMLIGLRMLTALGAGATLSAMGASLLALGRSILLFPLTALRAIGLAMWGLVANPVGLIIGVLVAAFVALGVWVSNNWNGIKKFFSAFGSGFMENLGPAALKWKDFEFRAIEIDPFDSRDGSEYTQHDADAAFLDRRHNSYQANKNLFLVHRVRASGAFHPFNKLPTYDITVYLLSHKNFGHLNDVREVHYYFGQHFGLKKSQFGTKFVVKNGTDNFAVRTNAYGPTLCEALIIFHDGTESHVSRYLDFEGTGYRFAVATNATDIKKISKRIEA